MTQTPMAQVQAYIDQEYVRQYNIAREALADAIDHAQNALVNSTATTSRSPTLSRQTRNDTPKRWSSCERSTPRSARSTTSQNRKSRHEHLRLELPARRSKRSERAWNQEEWDSRIAARSATKITRQKLSSCSKLATHRPIPTRGAARIASGQQTRSSELQRKLRQSTIEKDSANL